MTHRRSSVSKFARHRPIVFIGPSARSESIRKILPNAMILPPIRRDQLYRAREQGGRVFLIVDGVFGHDLAVSPREVVDVLNDGAVIYGASSMGALRAAECWPAGMRGVGTIMRLYRSGYLESDDEVAVATNRERDYAATSVALINVRYAASRAMKEKLLDPSAAKELVATAKAIFFPERIWRTLLNSASIRDSDGTIEAFCKAKDLKNKDAMRSAQTLRRALSDDPELGRLYDGSKDLGFPKRERYVGHDPLLGFDDDALNAEFIPWLFGSGRYQKYVWPLVFGEPEFRGLQAIKLADRRSEALRERLGEVLSRICSNCSLIASRLTAELEFLEEREAEMMRWYAVQTAATTARVASIRCDEDLLERTRAEVAIAHGVRDWLMLEEEVSDGLLFGAIPLQWIESACSDLALANTLKRRYDTRVAMNPYIETGKGVSCDR